MWSQSKNSVTKETEPTLFFLTMYDLISFLPPARLLGNLTSTHPGLCPSKDCGIFLGSCLVQKPWGGGAQGCGLVAQYPQEPLRPFPARPMTISAPCIHVRLEVEESCPFSSASLPQKSQECGRSSPIVCCPRNHRSSPSFLLSLPCFLPYRPDQFFVKGKSFLHVSSRRSPILPTKPRAMCRWFLVSPLPSASPLGLNKLVINVPGTY